MGPGLNMAAADSAPRRDPSVERTSKWTKPNFGCEYSDCSEQAENKTDERKKLVRSWRTQIDRATDNK